MKSNPAPRARGLLGVALLLLATASLQAEISPEAKEILERNLEASGGAAALEAVKSVHMSGVMSMPAAGINATTETIVVYPDKGYMKQVIPGMGEMVQAYTGDQGWSQNPMQGFRALSEKELQALRGQYDGIRDALRYEDRYQSAEALPSETIDGQPVNVLRVVVASTGDEETHYYSKEEGHLMQVKMTADMGEMGEMPITMKLLQMEKREGVLFPTKLQIANPAMTVEMSFNDIKVNAPVDESLFAAPQ